MLLKSLQFPLYKLRKYEAIYSTILGIKKIRTHYGEYILDDPSIPGNFEDRRLVLRKRYGAAKLYKLKERVDLLRQLVKYKSGAKFININGDILEYRKTSKLYKINSYPIQSMKEYGDNWTVIGVQGFHQKFLIGFEVRRKNIKYVSIMDTRDGPFLYDLTKEPHEPYRRKI